MPSLCLYYRAGRCICAKKCPSGYMVDGKRLCKEGGNIRSEKSSERVPK
jgi:hypothetical protein